MSIMCGNSVKYKLARKISLLLLLLFLVQWGQAVFAADDQNQQGLLLNNVIKPKLDIRGYYRFELAFRYNEPRSFTKMRNTFYLQSDYDFSNRLKFHGSGWFYYDVVYDLFDYDTIAARFEREATNPLVFVQQLPNEKDTPVAEFREMYFDLNLNKFDIRLGKQHVVWGVLEGVRVVDEINPMDFRELILPDDILDYRIPLWTLKINHFNKLGDYEFLLIPDLTFHQPAPPGSEWELFQDIPNTIKPEPDNPRNWELGFKWSNSISGTDVSLSYFYTWDDFPSVFRFSSEIGKPGPILFPTHTRLAMYGATFRRQTNSMILKAEAAYVSGKYFGTTEVDENADAFLDNNGEFLRDHIRWGVGFDVNWHGWDVSPSYVQWDILDYHPAIMQAEHDRSFNLYLRKKFRKANSTATILWIYLLDLNESYIKPRINFRISDRYRMAIGMDLFTGNQSKFGVATRSSGGGGPLVIPSTVEQRTQFFGNFNDNDRITIEMRYTF